MTKLSTSANRRIGARAIIEARRFLLPFLVAFSVCALATPDIAQAVGVSLPAGTVIYIRLETPVSTTSSHLHGAVTARVVREAVVDGGVALPLGTLVSGEIAKLIPTSSPTQRARVLMKFDRLTLPGESSGQAIEFFAHVAAIENARETVLADGTIQGVLESELPISMIQAGISKLGKRGGTSSSSGEQSGADVRKQSEQVLGKTDTSINYPAGTDVRLVLDKPLTLSRTFASTISDHLPQDTLVTIQNLLAGAPQRVAGKDGKPGDPINLVVVGSQAEIQQTFEKAGWLEPERSSGQSVWQATRAIIGEVGYGKAPVSDLYLFGRREDLAFAKMLNTVAKRHHLRLWRTDTRTADGREIWLGAATHDFGYDVRPGVISHAIDPDLDDERAKVGADLGMTGLVSTEQLVTRADPLSEGLTATGASWKTDGRLLAIQLNPAAK
jgi:LssY-like putative type I secretion system component LssY